MFYFQVWWWYGTVEIIRVLWLRLIAQTEAIWISETNSCLVLHNKRNVENLTVMLAEDCVLLVLMLSGLRRYKLSDMVGIWRLLYRQVSGPTLYTYRSMNGFGIGIVVARSDHCHRNTCRCMYLSCYLTQACHVLTRKW